MIVVRLFRIQRLGGYSPFQVVLLVELLVGAGHAVFAGVVAKNGGGVHGDVGHRGRGKASESGADNEELWGASTAGGQVFEAGLPAKNGPVRIWRYGSASGLPCG